MKVQAVMSKRDEFFQQLKNFLPADKLAEVTEGISHLCDLSFEAGRTLIAEREAYFASLK